MAMTSEEKALRAQLTKAERDLDDARWDFQHANGEFLMQPSLTEKLTEVHLRASALHAAQLHVVQLMKELHELKRKEHA